MSFFESQRQAFDTVVWEYTLVFEDLNDADLWKRAHPRLLSVGELTAHVVYAMVGRANALNPAANLSSTLAVDAVDYYLRNVEKPIELPMTVAEVQAELERVGAAARDAWLAVDKTRDEDSGTGLGTLGQLADYMVFHVSYHAGQAFSVRHLMGHKTNDN
jgi:uncharacterized damage-inducible protein DinB